MAQAHMSDWALWVTGAAFILLGTAWLACALWRDRSRGRLRCPACWYDMAGIATSDPTSGGNLRCPECGRVAPTGRSLLKTRRRWGQAATGAITIIAGMAAASLPTLRDPAWQTHLPSAVLVFVADIEPSGRSPRPMDRELEKRARDRKLALWQFRVAAARYMSSHPAEVRSEIHTRARWPAGASIWATTFTPFALRNSTYNDLDTQIRLARHGEDAVGEWLHPGAGDGFLVNLGRAPEGRGALEFEVELSEDGHSVWHGRIPANTEVDGTPESILTPFTSPSFDAKFVRWLKPRLQSRDDRDPPLLLEEDGRERAMGDEYLALGVHCEVRRQGRVVAHGTYTAYPELRGGRCGNAPTCTFVSLNWTERCPAKLNAEEGWELRVRGDRELALRDFDIFASGGAHPDPSKYWAGDVTVPLAYASE